MSAIYDNWDRLVAAVLKEQQLWELFHQQSRSPSIVSDASDLSLSDLGSEFSTSSKWHPNNLVLVSDFSPRFDVNDSSRASSVLLLGRGTFGGSYTATIDHGSRIVVKRLKPGPVSDLDFKRHMEIIGDVRHRNVVGLRAYYSSQGQRLMLYDYYATGSVSSLLHGQRDGNRVYVDWKTRMKIAIGAARGIAAIHSELGGMLVHGNIKASNVFLNQGSYGCISDLGLASMFKTSFDSTAHCYAPEVKKNTQNISHASDVYGFGILLLELLTRKSGVDVPGGPVALDLVKLVKSVRNKERAAKVFDADLLKHPTINEEMVKVLQIGIQCVAKSVKKRPKMYEVVNKLEDIIISNTMNRERNRLVFVEGVQVLGRGTIGTSFLGKLETGNTLVVKGLKNLSITPEDFQQKMEVLGRMAHENVAKLRAYSFSRERMILMYDYYEQGSISHMLYGESSGHLKWGARLKFAVGAARGIAHIHGQKIVHGNVKSSNIFLNGKTYGIVSDVGHVKLMQPMRLPIGYRGHWAPEIKVTSRVSQASDVYSFGVVLLELLCGRPSQHTRGDGVVTTLVKWVQLAVEGNLGIDRIFDKNCIEYETEEAMKRVFQIAMDCVSTAPKHRPTMPEVVQVLKEISDIAIDPTWEQLSFDTKLEYILEDLLPS